jgi:hypothetical protein
LPLDLCPARSLPIRRRASDYLIIEKEKVLDRVGHGIERGPALPRDDPNFEKAFAERRIDPASRPEFREPASEEVCAQAVTPIA